MSKVVSGCRKVNSIYKKRGASKLLGQVYWTTDTIVAALSYKKLHKMQL